MLVLGRKSGESLRIGTEIRVTVLSVAGGQVRLGIEAPDCVLVNREEIYERAAEANREAARATREALARSDGEEASEMGESS